MKTQLIYRLLALTLASAGRLSAQPPSLLTWSSNDQHTIQARFIGVGGQSVLIEKNGVVYNVPFSRLSAQSIAQARRLGAPTSHAAPTKAEAPAIIKVAKPEPPAKPESAMIAEMVKPDAPEKAEASKVTSVANPEALAQAETPRIVAVVKPEAPAKPETPKVIAAVKPVVLAKPVVSRPGLPTGTSPKSMEICSLMLAGKTAATTSEVPYAVQRAIEAGNFLQTKPYKWGGGHGSLMDTGYDCSGSVSHVLMQAGLLNSALTSSGFARYGAPGPGKWITIYAGSGHAFMSICGLRLDTGGRGGRGESGPRWCMASRGSAGWTLRHPPGF